MNKGEFIKAMAEKAGFTNKDAATAYDAFVATITETLKAGDKVQLFFRSEGRTCKNRYQPSDERKG